MPDLDGFAVAEEIRFHQELSGATIMMLTSSGQYGDAARCRELGVGTYLTKPVKQTDLFEAIYRALDRQAEESSIQPIGAAADGAPAAAQAGGAAQPLRQLEVLLAEDNPVNQQVAVGLLSKRGHHVTVVGNGREAVAALDGRAFDVVLMDVQMPEMGGLEATAVIRDRERQKGHKGDKPAHVRIVAMTAHAMKGDRDRCLAAGMDGYLSKPVDPKALFAAIELGDGEAVAPVAGGARPPAGAGVTFDRAELDRRTGGDRARAAELIRLFLEDCPVRMHAIRDAVGSGNAGGLRNAAHALKGAASYFSATHVIAAAGRLEKLGQEDRMADAVAVQRRLELEVTRLLADLRSA